MKAPLQNRRWLLLPLGLLTGTAIGVLLPNSDAPRNGDLAQADSTLRPLADAEAAPLDRATKPPGSGQLFPGSRSDEPLGKLPPEKLLAIFERLSNLKSDSRKYSLAYRLASQMEAGQIEAALDAALKDLSDGDYVTTRAIACGWE